MDAGLLELARPDDVRGFVEARLHLHEGQHLLARFGRVDERLHDRAVARGAVQGLLDGEDVRVFRRLLEEQLHARREGLVGVVHEHIALADRGEDVGAAVLLGGLERQRGRRNVRGVVQLRPVDPRQVEQSAQIEQTRQAVDLLRRDVELLDQQVEGDVVDLLGDLEADRGTEPPPQELGLERLDEVLGLVLLDHHVLIAREAERVVVEDLHAREEVFEVIRDDVFEGDVPRPVAVARDLDEPGEHRRDLEPGEVLTPRAGVADADREVERQPRDVREGVRRVDRERHQDGEDLGLEVLVGVRLLLVGQGLPGEDVDAGLGERGLNVVHPRRSVADLEAVGLGGDVGEDLLRRPADVRRDGQAGDDPALEPGDADHEELVQVAREDGEEVRPLEHGQIPVFRQLQHPLVEGEPADLAVQIPVVGELRDERLREVEVVIIRVAEPGVEHLVFDHPIIIAGTGDERVNSAAAARRTVPTGPEPGRPRTR